MISSSINWYAGGFCKARRKKSVTSHTTFQISLSQKIRSSYLLFHREKMGSHLLVETSRNPECPKVSFRRWFDSFFPLVLFWHWPMSVRRTLFTGILQRKLLSLSLSCIPDCAWQVERKYTLKPYKTVWRKHFLGFHMSADSSEAHRPGMILNWSVRLSV